MRQEIGPRPLTAFAARAALIAALLGAGLHGPQALAQEANPAAQALYDQATTEMDAGKYESACKKLEEVIRIVPDGLGAKMTLAQCYEGMGRLASAWSQYEQVDALARKSKQTSRATKAAAKATALKKKLAYLTIDVAAEARGIPGLEILRDGTIVGQAQWGLALPVDRGSHTLTARAAGYKPWSGNIDVPEDGKQITAPVPALEPEPAPRPTATAQPTTSVTAAPSAAAVAPPPARTWQTPLGVAVLAAGVAGLAAGGTFGGLALLRRDESVKAGCNDKNQCPPAAVPVRNEARLFGDISTIGLIAGGALTVAGAVILITAPRDTNKKEARTKTNTPLSAELVPLFGGAALRGAF